MKNTLNDSCQTVEQLENISEPLTSNLQKMLRKKKMKKL